MQSIIAQNKLHFFEYMQVQILQQYIREGINYFLNALLNSHPLLTPLRYYCLQVTAILDFLKDLYFLLKNNALYAQHFYSFERSPKQTKYVALRNALLWTVIPYLCKKVDVYYNELMEDDGRNRHNILKNLFKMVYPYLYLLLGISQTILKFRYLFFRDSKDFNILYKVSNTQLSYQENNESNSKSNTKYPIYSLLKQPGLLVLLMSHKVLSWYFNQKNNAAKGGSQKAVKAPLDEGQIEHPGKCPLCGSKVREPAFIRNSGFTYCYDCITEYVRKEGKCPMSSLEATQESIQLIYS